MKRFRWHNLAQHRDQWRVLVNTIMNPRVFLIGGEIYREAGQLLASQGICPMYFVIQVWYLRYQ